MTGPLSRLVRPGRARRGCALALLAAALAVPAAGCGGKPAPRHAILVLLDAARPDRFSCYGYGRPTTPRIDALAAKGLVFDRHFTQGPYTRTALPSLLYSRYYIQPLFPHSNRIPFASPEDLFRKPDDEAISLPAALSRAGFRTVMISAHTWLKMSTAFAREFDEAYDLPEFIEPEGNHAYPSAAQAVDFTLAWMAKHQEQDWFIYLHLMDTHFPHVFGEDAAGFLPENLRAHPPVNRFDAAGAPRDLTSPLGPGERAYLDALYDGGLHFADRQLGRLLDSLGDGIDQTLVAVTSDHGEYLADVPGRFGHGPPWYDVVARVPLIISYPAKLSPGHVSMVSEAVDLLPTLLGLLDVSLPEGKHPDGFDMVAAAASGKAPREDAVMRSAIRSDRYKALFDTRDDLLVEDTLPPGEPLAGKLYDLQADPLETKNVWEAHPDACAALAAAYRSRMKRPFERYMASVTHEQPESPFALGAQFLDAGLTVRSTSDLGEVERLFTSGDGWLRIDDGETHLISAHGKTTPLKVEVALPDGRYALSALIRGTSTFVTASGTEARSLQGRAFDPNEYFPWVMDSIDFGEIRVTGENLSMTILPERAAGPFLFGGFGFKPLDRGEPMDEQEEKETLERLRALGYVN